MPLLLLGDSWLGILFLIALCNGGFGFGGGFGGGYGNMMLGYDFPWLLNGQNEINSNVNGGCESISVTNISTQAINVMNANLIITYQGVRRIR